MKALLAFVLLCFFTTVFMVEGHHEGAGDPCTRAKDAFEYFEGMKSCGYKPLAEYITRQLGRALTSSNLTVTGLKNLYAVNCRMLFPAKLKCFRAHLQNCSTEQKTYLTGVLEQTGFICEPNTTNVHPAFKHLVEKMTDEDLQLDEDCFTASIRHIEQTCYQEAIASIGMTFREFADFIMRATVQEFLPCVPRIRNSAFECRVRMIREQPNRCAQWRGLALKYASLDLLHTTSLGNTLTFTKSELLEMFELDELQQSEGSMDTLL